MPVTNTSSDLNLRIDSLKAKLDLEGLKSQSLEIENMMADPNFWQDQENARKKSQELSELKKDIDNLEMLDLYLEEGDTASLEKLVYDLELKTYLSGLYDKNDAILSIHAGQGGTEAMDWAEMLERMYLRYFEKKGWQADVVDRTAGDEAGIKNVTITVAGRFAYGYLKNEVGAHRLVRQSPFNADKLRQTSFAKVEVLPQVAETGEIEIPENELEWDFYRASSHGGQNVQKVSTAVKLTHKPTGIVINAQSQRYQEQNRKIALALLQAKLWQIKKDAAKSEEQKLKGEVKLAGWGNQIRSYVLHPYKMVKDLRTEAETSDAEGVLDGDLDLFVDAELRKLVR
jgi:peptide chain release factor 2